MMPKLTAGQRRLVENRVVVAGITTEHEAFAGLDYETFHREDVEPLSGRHDWDARAYFDVVSRVGLVNIPCGLGRTPLRYAIELGKLDWWLELLRKGAHPGMADRFDVTPVHVAASSNKHADFLGPALQVYGKAVEQKNGLGLTPLDVAITTRSTLIVELLLSKGVCPVRQSRQTKSVLQQLSTTLTNPVMRGMVAEAIPKLPVLRSV